MHIALFYTKQLINLVNAPILVRKDTKLSPVLPGDPVCPVIFRIIV